MEYDGEQPHRCTMCESVLGYPGEKGKSDEQWYGDARRTCLMDGAKGRFVLGSVKFKLRTDSHF